MSPEGQSSAVWYSNNTDRSLLVCFPAFFFYPGERIAYEKGASDLITFTLHAYLYFQKYINIYVCICAEMEDKIQTPFVQVRGGIWMRKTLDGKERKKERIKYLPWFKYLMQSWKFYPQYWWYLCFHMRRTEGREEGSVLKTGWQVKDRRKKIGQVGNMRDKKKHKSRRDSPFIF